MRGELSAIDAYDLAIQAVASAPLAHALLDLRARHQEHAQKLRELVESLGAEPDRDSGCWGLWARAVTIAASFLGPAAVLATMREGEQHGLAEYESHLCELEAESAHLVRDELIPATREQIGLISELLREVPRLGTARRLQRQDYESAL